MISVACTESATISWKLLLTQEERHKIILAEKVQSVQVYVNVLFCLSDCRQLESLPPDVVQQAGLCLVSEEGSFVEFYPPTLSP